MVKKPIELSDHVLERLANRGTNKIEIQEAIRTGIWAEAELGRLESRKNFTYNKV
jgi:hypothetical protein